MLKKRSVPDELEPRKQPARAAKKPVNCKETDQSPSHVTKRNITSTSSSAVTMILLTTAVLCVNTTVAQRIVCSNKGVLLNSSTPGKSEVCVNYKECTAVPADINASEIILPFKYLVNQHIDQWRTIVNSEQETETIICPQGEQQNQLYILSRVLWKFSLRATVIHGDYGNLRDCSNSDDLLPSQSFQSTSVFSESKGKHRAA